MKIVINEKVKPFSHTPGTACPIPGTCLEVEAFPSLLIVAGKKIPMKVAAPVKEFTLELDVEKGCCYVYGQGADGYYKVRIEADDSGISVSSEKGTALAKETRVDLELAFIQKKPLEKLFLGSNKAQNWDRQVELEGSLPLLFALGQRMPEKLKAEGGTYSLLEMPKERDKLEAALIAFFDGAFSKMLIPRLEDEEHQGLDLPQAKGDRWALIADGSKMVRALFFSQNERRIAFLPKLPVPFHTGKMTGVLAKGIGEIDFEWSKKLLRQAHIRATTSGEVVLELQKEIKRFRLNQKECHLSNQPLFLEKGKSYFLDRFEK